MPIHIWLCIIGLGINVVFWPVYAFAKWWQRQQEWRALDDPSYYGERARKENRLNKKIRKKKR